MATVAQDKKPAAPQEQADPKAEPAAEKKEGDGEKQKAIDKANDELNEFARQLNAAAQEDKRQQGVGAQRKTPATELRFAFEGTPWRDVIKWLANESALALHVDSVPTGSFTYTDANPFSPQAAIDRVNLFLLAEGYALVRSGKLLSVINLSDPRSVQKLDALAELVTVDKLDAISNHTIAKCFFKLDTFKAADAVEELAALNLMSPPAVFTKTNQILVTDVAGKLKNVKAVLSAIKPSALDDGTVMKNFMLKHIDAEDFLEIARPHLGLATGESIGIDVSLSSDPQGKSIFVTGISDRVKIVENLVSNIDVPREQRDPDMAEAKLERYAVTDGDVELVYNVLVTMLANKPVRLSMDKSTSSVIVLAAPKLQADVAKTVDQLQSGDTVFEVIQLKTVDPYFVISLLEEMLKLNEDPTSTTTSSNFNSFDRRWDDRRWDDRRWGDRGRGRQQQQEAPTMEPPKIDADPATRRLFVRGKKYQIEQIKQIVERIDVAGTINGSDTIRLLPLRGQRAIQLLEAAAKFWRAENPIILYPSTDATNEKRERVVTDRKVSTQPRASATGPTTARVLTNNIRSQAPVIRCQLTPRGLIIQCEDAKALDKFEDHLRQVLGPGDTMPSPPIVFYLKYTKSNDALHMLAELLDGGNTAMESEVGSLVNGTVGGTSLLGSLIMSREGTMTMMADTLTVVSDTRLNRLIAQGTEADIERIEQYLKIIDKDSSLTSIETYGKSHIIELAHTRAAEVAAAIRDAYADRIAGGSSTQQRQQGGGNQNQQGRRPEGGERRDEGDDRKEGGSNQNRSGNQRGQNRQGGRGARSLEPKLTVAVHERSNSLIVTAPEPLFKEVEALAKLIDQRSEQAVEMVVPKNASAISTMLQQAFTVRSAPSAPSGGGSPQSSGGSSPASRSGGGGGGGSARTSTPRPQPQPQSRGGNTSFFRGGATPFRGGTPNRGGGATFRRRGR